MDQGATSLDRQMTPDLAPDDLAEERFAHAVLCGQLRQLDSVRSTTCPNLQDLGFGQLGSSMLLASAKQFWVGDRCVAVPAWVPAFSGAIGCVVCVGSQEQMIRTNTGRIIAAVADKQSLRDRSVVQRVRVSMRTDALAVPTANRERPVTKVEIGTADPSPACIGLLNELPKPYFCWNGSKGHGSDSTVADVRIASYPVGE